MLNDLIDCLKIDCKAVTVCNLKFRSVSCARNVGLNISSQSGCSHIFFHDISIVVTRGFAAKFKYLDKIMKFPYGGRPIFSNSSASVIQSELPVVSNMGNFVEVGAYPIFNPYIWTYIFPLSLISDVRFDERIGPGDTTLIKAGEDFIFLSAVLSKTNFRKVRSYPASLVVHPARELSDKKNIIYARGQGYAYKATFLKYRRLVDFLYILLFIGNAFKNFIFCRNNSLKILSERISGLLFRLD